MKKTFLAMLLALAAMAVSAQTTDYPAGLPDELKKEPTDGPLPSPVFRSGMATLRFHLLADDVERLLAEQSITDGHCALHVNQMLGFMPHDSQKSVPLLFDKSGNATAEMFLDGTAWAFIDCNDLALGSLWIAPGEEADVYIDGRFFQYQKEREETEDGGGKAKEPEQNGFIYTTGRYADLNRINDIYRFREFNIEEEPRLDYKMTGDEYTAEVIRHYRAASEIIDSLPMHRMQKELYKATLQQETLSMMCDLRQALNYTGDDGYTRRYPADSLRTVVEPRHKQQVAQLFNVASPALLMGTSTSSYLRTVGEPWADVAEGSVFEQLIWYVILAERFVPDGQLDHFFQQISGQPGAPKSAREIAGDFLGSVLERKNAEALRDKAKLASIAQPTPDVPDERLLETILAPHRGKVVLIDFWNTWCAPCRAAIKQNEPLKDSELSNPDLVWIYLADESSPLAAYTEQIPQIRGLHYRLPSARWRFLTQQFPGIDGIPAYVLVRRDGTCQLRLDFRDHKTMKRELLKALDK